MFVSALASADESISVPSFASFAITAALGIDPCLTLTPWSASAIFA